MHHHRQRRGGQGPQTGLGIIKHVIRVGTAGLERLHVVLDAHHGIGEAVEPLCRKRRGFQQHAMHFYGQCRHHIPGTLTVEHPEGGTNTPRQLIHGGGGHRHLLRHGTGYRFLDTRQVDDALAQHSGLHAMLLGIMPIMAGIALLILEARGYQTDECLIEPILNADEGGGHFHEQTIAGRQTASDHVLESSNLGPHPRTQRTQVEDAERVADFAQQLYLRHEFSRVLRALANEDIQHVFDAREIFADGGTHCAHQCYRGRRQMLAFTFDGCGHRQQFLKPEGSSHRLHAHTSRRGIGYVIKKIVEQFQIRCRGVMGLALFIQALELAVRLAQQTFRRGTRLKASFTERFDDCADHPPELKHGLQYGDLLQTFCHFGKHLKVLLRVFTANPAQQADLEARAQSTGPLLRVEWRLARHHYLRLRLAIGRQIQHQQGAFGKQRAAAYRPQIIEQRQQYQG